MIREYWDESLPQKINRCFYLFQEKEYQVVSTGDQQQLYFTRIKSFCVVKDNESKSVIIIEADNKLTIWPSDQPKGRYQINLPVNAVDYLPELDQYFGEWLGGVLVLSSGKNGFLYTYRHGTESGQLNLEEGITSRSRFAVMADQIFITRPESGKPIILNDILKLLGCCFEKRYYQRLRYIYPNVYI